ncbi:MAG: S8 family serine peptidase [Pseudomonadota bacterium]
MITDSWVFNQMTGSDTPSNVLTETSDIFWGAGHQRWWHLEHNRDGPSVDVIDIWDDYSGAGVTVAVHDEMVNFNHPDLKENYDSSIDYDLNKRATKLDYPFGTDASHGTAVAGVIGAANNGFGTIGIAYEARLTSLAFSYESENVIDEVLTGISRAKNYDIVNNSWSFVKAFTDRNFGDSLIEPVTEGRDGLGTIMVFSASNQRSAVSSNYLDFQNSPYAVAVGAVDKEGDAASFSSIGTNVLVSTAGVNIKTTTRDDNYSGVDGTSFAAPMVSGVVALMLEANPDLGYRDVQEILAYSSKISELGDRGHTANDWVINGADNYNGGGLHYSDVFGYGFVNAFAAVRLAETWTKQQTIDNLQTHVVDKQFDTPLRLVAGDTDSLSVSFEVTENIVAEHVQLALDFSWRDSGNLEVYLTSPDGTRSQLMYDLYTPDAVGDFRLFEFTTVASMGENAAGTWTIDIVNPDPDANFKGETMTGEFKGFTATILGEAPSVTNTYIYTDEFAVLYDDELTERVVLRDRNGGTDTINAAAVTTDSTLDLNRGPGAVIAGHALTIEGLIENAVGGDGDDTLIGNNADNHLHGGRGDDHFTLSAGDDTLDGGRGQDKLVIEADFNAFSAFELIGDTLSLAFNDGATALIQSIEAFVVDGVNYGYNALVDALEDVSNTDDRPDSGQGSGGASVITPPPPADTPKDDVPPNNTGNDDDDTPHDWLGEAPDDAILGKGGAERLKGNMGTDSWLDGGAGDDTLLGLDGQDTLIGGEGDDLHFGHGANDVLKGGNGNNRLVGGEGDDTLIAEAGDNVLVGEEGADTFVISADTFGGKQRITDFSAADGDTIVLLDPDNILDTMDIVMALSWGTGVQLSAVNKKGDALSIVEIHGDFDAETLLQLKEVSSELLI